MPPFTRTRPADHSPGADPGPLPDWRKDPRIAELVKRRDEADARTRKLEAAIVGKEGTLDRVLADLEPLEVDLLAGHGSQRDIEKATAAVTKARAELAEAREKAADSAEELRKFGAALLIATDDAKTTARLAMIGPYRQALARLDGLLLEASEASEAVYRLWRSAAEQFSSFGSERSPRGVVHPDCGGLIRASWPDLALPGQLAMDGRTETKFARWHADVADNMYVVEVELPLHPPVTPPKPPTPVMPPPRYVPDVTAAPATPQVRYVPDVDAVDAEEAGDARLGWIGRQ
jgi:hypothetical protein